MSRIPAGAGRLCVVAADSGHGSVDPENAMCVAIPVEVR